MVIKLKIYLPREIKKDFERLISASQGVDTIYHCAALKHVELGEYNAEEIVKTNINGTNNSSTRSNFFIIFF